MTGVGNFPRLKMVKAVGGVEETVTKEYMREEKNSVIG